MFAGGCRGENPFLPQPRRQGNVDRVDVGTGEKLGVAADRLRNRIVRHLGLAFGDEGGGLFTRAARHRDESAVATVADGLPVLAGDARASEDAPAAQSFVHKMDGVD